MNMDIHRVTVT